MFTLLEMLASISFWNLSDLRCSAHIPVLNFACQKTQFSMLHSAFLQTHPERTSQDTPSKPQTLRFHLTYPCLEFCLNTSRCHIAHFGKPILNQRTPQDTPSKPQTLRFYLTCLTFARTALHITPRISANTSWTNIQSTKFISHHKISSYASPFWNLQEQLPKLHHACLQTHPRPVGPGLAGPTCRRRRGKHTGPRRGGIKIGLLPTLHAGQWRTVLAWGDRLARRPQPVW